MDKNDLIQLIEEFKNELIKVNLGDNHQIQLKHLAFQTKILLKIGSAILELKEEVERINLSR